MARVIIQHRCLVGKAAAHGLPSRLSSYALAFSRCLAGLGVTQRACAADWIARGKGVPRADRESACVQRVQGIPGAPILPALMPLAQPQNSGGESPRPICSATQHGLVFLQNSAALQPCSLRLMRQVDAPLGGLLRYRGPLLCTHPSILSAFSPFRSVCSPSFQSCSIICLYIKSDNVLSIL